MPIQPAIFETHKIRRTYDFVLMDFGLKESFYYQRERAGEEYAHHPFEYCQVRAQRRNSFLQLVVQMFVRYQTGLRFRDHPNLASA